MATKGGDAFYKRKTTVKGVVYQKDDMKPTVEKDIQNQIEKQKELLEVIKNIKRY